jgi:hypothetical protein
MQSTDYRSFGQLLTDKNCAQIVPVKVKYFQTVPKETSG